MLFGLELVQGADREGNVRFIDGFEHCRRVVAVVQRYERGRLVDPADEHLAVIAEPAQNVHVAPVLREGDVEDVVTGEGSCCNVNDESIC